MASTEPRETGREGLPLAALVRAAQAGDRAAFRQVYERTARPVIRTTRALAASEADAEDAAHDAFAIAWERLPTYREQPGATFLSWLLRIATNVVRMRRRKDRRLTLVSRDSLESHGEDAPASDAMLQRRLREHLGALPERDRSVLVLRYAGELTAREVASATDLSEANVRKICQRRRAELFAALRGAGR